MKYYMKMAGLSQVAVFYAGLVVMVYLGTDGFNKNAPFVFTIPVVALGLLTLNTRIHAARKLCTSASFFVLAAALYHWSMSPRQLERNAALLFAAHVLYALSFAGCVHRWWRSLALATAAFSLAFTYGVFFDLFRSLPGVVLVCVAAHGSIAYSFVAAGSVWKMGSRVAYAETAAFARFMGIFFMYVCDVALLSNQFGRHTKQLVFYLNTTYYLAQYLMYFANERAF